MASPPTDGALTNLLVTGILTANKRLVSNQSFIGNASIVDATIDSASIGDATLDSASIGDATLDTAVIGLATIDTLTNETLGTATLNNGLQFDNIQNQVKFDDHRNFILSNTVAQLSASLALPVFPGGRTVTFNNMTTSTTLDLYVTEGYPNATPPTLVTTLAPAGGTTMWPIPTTAGWNGNFTAYPTGSPVLSGSTLAEFGFNQLWSGSVPPLRETLDVSNVPPGIGTLCNDGPHGFPPDTNNCVFFSRQSGFSTQQSFGYNVGIRIIPPVGALPSATVTVTQPDGGSSDAISFPNDTSFPRQQTIELTGSYTVDLLDPVLPLP